MHYAIHGQTTAELVTSRVNSRLPNMRKSISETELSGFYALVGFFGCLPFQFSLFRERAGTSDGYRGFATTRGFLIHRSGMVLLCHPPVPMVFSDGIF